MTRHLLVPGRGAPSARHWMWLWAAAHPDYRWAPAPGTPLVFRERVAALTSAVSASAEPAVLIAHSAGCLSVAMWAARHSGPVRAALLVTPPLIDGFAPDLAVPRRRLPFPAVLVASRNDPYTTFAEFTRMAADWGADLVDAGPVGHLDTASGFGPWPAGEALVGALSAGVPGLPRPT